MDEQDLKKVLCYLQPGWALTLPDEWIEQTIPGTRMQQAERVKEIAQDYGCALKYAPGTHTFERYPYTRTG